MRHSWLVESGDRGERLFICEQTVKDHLHDVFEKVKIRRRSELAAKLLEFGLS